MSHTITSTQAFGASESGALPGFESICSCGFKGRTSINASTATQLGNEHADYMNAKNAPKAPRARRAARKAPWEA